MSSINQISPEKLVRLVGTPKCPVLLDVRTDEDFSADPYLIPGALRRPHAGAADWADEYAGRSVVVACQKGLKLSQGAAAWLRHAGAAAEALEGGTLGWQEARLPRVAAEKLPGRDDQGRTVWVTRARPKIDRIACPWLIRRFVDPLAVFLFVAPSEVEAVAERFGAMPFDVEGVFWSHRAEKCSFDTFLDELGLATEPLLRLATVVRGADTARLDLAPEAAGLLAASLGLSRMFSDDLAQLEAAMTLYDAFYRWCRDATGKPTTGQTGGLPDVDSGAQEGPRGFSGDAASPSFGEALRVWLKIGLINFGGPAGQIALMHRILVDERRWIDEKRFLHALNYCMLLPGPEAQQLATYIGWLMHGTRGGLAAGLLFILPGFLVILGLSIAYATLGDVPVVQGILFGLKAAVLAIVAEALLRVSKRALKGRIAYVIAMAAFVGIAFFHVPFPLIIAAAALVGFLRTRWGKSSRMGSGARRQAARPLPVCLENRAPFLHWGGGALGRRLAPPRGSRGDAPWPRPRLH
jgi:chromate transport protein ChrA/rhodanese-related sulfurtransferase